MVKKLLFLCCVTLLMFTQQSYAESFVVNISAGGLESAIQQVGNKFITNLTIKGSVNSLDIKFIREDTVYLKNLMDLDIGEVILQPDGGIYNEYSGGFASNDYAYIMSSGNWSEGQPNVMYAEGAGMTWHHSNCLAGAFMGMPLKKVVWPKSLSHVGTDAFSGCDSLRAVVLHEGIVKIESGAFRGCVSLSSVNIPAGIQSLSKYAFVGTSLDGGPFETVNNVIYCGMLAYGVPNDIPEGTVLNIREGTKFINDEFSSEIEDGKILSINLPSTIQRIGHKAFLDCNVEEITIPENVEFLGISSLYGAKKVTMLSKNVNVSQSQEEGYDLASPFTKVSKRYSSMGPFVYYYSTLESIVISPKVESIPRNFFYLLKRQYDSAEDTYTYGTILFQNRNRKALEICNGAFRYCTLFKEICLPEGTTVIGDYAFSNSSFERIVLPSTVSSFGDYLLDESSIQEIESKNKNPHAISVLTFRQDEGSSVDGIYENATLRVPFGTSSKYKSTNGWKLFANIVDEDLSSVIATSESNPELIEIARSRGWISQTANQMTIEDAIAVTDISGAFEGKEIATFDEFMYFTNITAIPANCFNGCTKLSRITFPEELTSIGERAFYGCDLESITIPKNVKSIGKDAFYDNKNLSSVVSLIEEPFDVDKSAFSYYFSNNFSGVIFGGTVFTNASLTVPFGTMEAYKSKEGWKEFTTIEEAEINIGDIMNKDSEEGVPISFVVLDTEKRTCAVGEGERIAAIDTKTSGKVTIPASVNGYSVVATSVGAFENCTFITEVVVPEGVEELGGMTFYNCESLEKVSLPSTLKRMRGVTFGYCRSLVSVNLPESFESFYNGEFAVCTSLKSIHIPDHITDIPDQNFNNCYNLVSVNFPTQLKSIGAYAFFNCEALQSLILPDLLETIGEFAFDWCDNVKTVTIPQNITSIGDYAFCVCTSLEKVRVKTPTPISINKEAFNVNQTDFTTATLYVPKGSKQQYKEAEGWKLFSNIVEFDPDATTVVGTTIDPKDRNVYSVDGRKQHEVSPGLNIIRMSDGTVRKVVKK